MVATTPQTPSPISQTHPPIHASPTREQDSAQERTSPRLAQVPNRRTRMTRERPPRTRTIRRGSGLSGERGSTRSKRPPLLGQYPSPPTEESLRQRPSSGLSEARPHQQCRGTPLTL